MGDSIAQAYLFAIKTRTIMKEKSLHYSKGCFYMLNIYTKKNCKKLWELYTKVHDAANKLDYWCRDNYNLKISDVLAEDENDIMNAWLLVEGICIADYMRYMYPDSSNKADYEKAYENALHLVKVSTDMLSVYVEALKR